MNIPFDKYDTVIGLEVHAQLKTASKAFSSDGAYYGAPSNTLIDPISLGHPGTLPVLNKKQVELAVRLGLALNCQIRKRNEFSRKNYFYPDLPKGYQITQFDTPICFEGSLVIETNKGVKHIGITRIHMEEDSGKSTHDLDPYFTLVDLNRAGVPLVEIVSEPEMSSSDEAYAYLTEIRKLVRYLDVCDGNMEEGSLRCDANVSVMLKGAKEFGEKVEVKNMNSIRNVKRALDYEVKRQIIALENGEEIQQSTRGFDPVKGSTFLMRLKEDAHDYRYFNEPDLPPLLLDEVYIDEVRKKLPALPRQLVEKYTSEFGLSKYDALVLTDDKAIAEYFEELAGICGDYKLAANWVMGPVKAYLNEHAIELSQFPLKVRRLAELVSLVQEGKINHSTANQKLFPALIEDQESNAEQLANKMNLLQDIEEDDIRTYIDEALAQYPDKVAAYRNGKKGLLGLFMGEVMKRSKGKADPKKTNQWLRMKLEE
tara:strand:- start:1417 stop:2868 length:1452 start_codon:yes stop_codon:yes gene_type:complete